MKKILIGLIFFSSFSFASIEFVPKSLQLDFEQSFISITGDKKNSKGQLAYQYPGQLRLKEFKDNTEFVCNNENSWYYIPPFTKGEKGTVQINNSKNMIISKLFDKLKLGLVNIPNYYKVNVKDKNQVEIIFLEEGQKDLKLSSLLLNFSMLPGEELPVLEEIPTKKSKRKKLTLKEKEERNKIELSQKEKLQNLSLAKVSSLHLVYLDKKMVDLTFLNYSEAMNFPKDNFVFKVPENTEIIKN